MTVSTTYPGVYIQEVPSGVRAITGVATSITAFIGRTRRGPVDVARVVNGFADYERTFGGLSPDSTVSFAVRDFFANGGGQAIVVRVLHQPAGKEKPAAPATGAVDSLNLVAVDPGTWANGLDVKVTHPTADAAKYAAAQLGVADTDLFNLTITDPHTGAQEVFDNVTVKASSRQVDAVLEAGSQFVRVADPNNLPSSPPADGASVTMGNGTDGLPLVGDDYVGGTLAAAHKGLFALDAVDLFNLLCIPPPSTGGDTPQTVYDKALDYCFTRRAMLLVDPPKAMTVTDAAKQLGSLSLTGPRARNAALYFPRIVQVDEKGQRNTFVPCGAVAGIYARTDASRGVWKAPAGTDAALAGVADLDKILTDDENGELNPLGVNCLRSFPIIGRVVWGARTLRGADVLADEYKYVPVRRLALYIEESLFRGTQWVVFEPNDEPLWAQIRLNVGAFMQDLFRQGALQGTSPRDAYFVKCDRETTTQTDVNLGRVNILVGFAPLRPAEFVIIKIQQILQA
jgi:phage tail sheath protein FI